MYKLAILTALSLTPFVTAETIKFGGDHVILSEAAAEGIRTEISLEDVENVLKQEPRNSFPGVIYSSVVAGLNPRRLK